MGQFYLSLYLSLIYLFKVCQIYSWNHNALIVYTVKTSLRNKCYKALGILTLRSQKGKAKPAKGTQEKMAAEV